jgi:uncharacterized protein HemX
MNAPTTSVRPQNLKQAPTASVRRPAAPSFRLLRYFSLASLAVIAAVAVALAAFYGWKAEQALLQQGEQKNAAQLRLILQAGHLSDSQREQLRAAREHSMTLLQLLNRQVQRAQGAPRAASS